MEIPQLIRKIHVYSGAALFVPLLLFALSGFMLNHRWGPWNNFESRIETETPVRVALPAGGTDLDKAKQILETQGFKGEINMLVVDPEKDNLLIRAVRPGRWIELNLSISRGDGTQKITQLNGWSLLNNFHTFTGLHSNIPDKKNWSWTKVWSVIMDASALAMTILLATGIYLMAKSRNERFMAFLVLGFSGVIIIIVLGAISLF